MEKIKIPIKGKIVSDAKWGNKVIFKRQYPKDFINQIIEGNYLEIIKEIPNKSIDLVFTDPPYNISQKKKIFRDYRSGKRGDINFDFGEWDYNFDPIPFLEEAKRVLRDDGSIIVWMGEQIFAIYRTWFEKNMHPKQLLIWEKTNPIPSFRLVGYRQTTELMYWATKNKLKKNCPNFLFQKQEEMKNVFHAPIVGGRERTKHPTQKPLSICQEIIKRHCREGGIVLDSFTGSGTIPLAAKNLNRNFIGIEISKEYCDIAKQRLRQDNLFKGLRKRNGL